MPIFGLFHELRYVREGSLWQYVAIQIFSNRVEKNVALSKRLTKAKHVKMSKPMALFLFILIDGNHSRKKKKNQFTSYTKKDLSPKEKR